MNTRAPKNGGGFAPYERLLILLSLSGLIGLVTWHPGQPGGGVEWATLPIGAALALNAGMFVEQLPWGWVVSEGRERLPPGHGPLSSALVGLADGRLVWIDGDDVSKWRGPRGPARFAFESYPALLAGDGLVLDGGISAQLTISDSTGHARVWKGLRKVPLALVARARRK